MSSSNCVAGPERESSSDYEETIAFTAYQHVGGLSEVPQLSIQIRYNTTFAFSGIFSI